jgi:cytochrome c oxidase cbb3-type subunit 3
MRRPIKLAVVIAGMVCAACQRHDPPAPAAAAPVMSPVGPVPGPGEESAAGANPYDGDREALREGRILFKRWNCSGCHGDHAGGGMGPSLRDVDWRYGDSDEHIYDSIAEGRSLGMPAWGTKIPEKQMWELTAYVRSLRTDREPDAP